MTKIIDLEDYVSSISRLQYLVVDYANDGRVYLYISDAATGAIIVFDLTSNHGFRFVLPQTVSSGSERRDVLYLALVGKNSNSPVVYFTYLSSNKLFRIKASQLRSGLTNGSVDEIGTKNNKIIILGTDNRSAMFFRNKGQSLTCLNSNSSIFFPFKKINFLIFFRRI